MFEEGRGKKTTRRKVTSRVEKTMRGGQMRFVDKGLKICRGKETRTRLGREGKNKQGNVMQR